MLHPRQTVPAGERYARIHSVAAQVCGNGPGRGQIPRYSGPEPGGTAAIPPGGNAAVRESNRTGYLEHLRLLPVCRTLRSDAAALERSRTVPPDSRDRPGTRQSPRACTRSRIRAKREARREGREIRRVLVPPVA